MKARGPFGQILECCLQELSRSDDVEASLALYPQHADQLRPLLQVAQAACDYYDAVPEAPGGLAAGRERLLAVAAEQRSERERARRFIPVRRGAQKVRFVFGTRLVPVVLAVVVGMAVLVTGVVWAAGDSVPGDSLYPVKLIVEDTRLAIAAAPADQIDMLMQFIEERVDEIQALVRAGERVPDDAIVRMERHIERAMTQAAWATDAEMTSLLMQVSERTRIQAQVLEQVRATASGQSQAGLTRAMAVCEHAARIAEDGLSDPQAFRRRYRHLDGGSGPADEPAQVTPTWEGDQEWDQERLQQQEPTRTPAPTVSATLEVPQVMPHDPQTTPYTQAPSPSPESMSPRPQATAVPQATPSPRQTPVPPATSPQPQQPGSGQHGGGQDGGGGQGGSRD